MSTTAGAEPPAGYKGEGTVNQPFDQGNALEAPEGSGTEPVSGVQGKGTTDEPYDKGNAGANNASSALIDGILGRKKGKSTIIDTATGKPASDAPPSPASTQAPSLKTNGATPAPSKLNDEASQENSTVPITAVTPPTQVTSPTQPATTSAPSEPSSTPAGSEKQPEENRGREFLSFSQKRVEERSVSPATLPDGRHAQTSGDKGQSYSPPTKLGKLGAKLGLGH